MHHFERNGSNKHNSKRSSSHQQCIGHQPTHQHNLSPNKEAMESNNLCHQEFERQIEQEEKKKDRTKKLHPAIVTMHKQAAATDWNDEDKEIAPTCLCFINSDNVGIAHYKLIHQFKESRFPDVTFSLGTTQALYLGDFLYADLSSPSNFTVFAFHEQEPDSSNQQTDYLICHLMKE
jgi:hypothetical protein